ncbi:MAG: hypothetical protein HYV07_03405 [Deltaproteobacteria bacterium]|nr:hypothetical protein [Deltaproteobacteria bacterium]
MRLRQILAVVPAMVASGCVPGVREIVSPEAEGARSWVFVDPSRKVILPGPTVTVARGDGYEPELALGWVCPSLDRLGFRTGEGGLIPPAVVRAPDVVLALDASGYSPANADLSELGFELAAPTPCGAFVDRREIVAEGAQSPRVLEKLSSGSAVGVFSDGSSFEVKPDGTVVTRPAPLFVVAGFATEDELWLLLAPPRGPVTLGRAVISEEALTLTSSITVSDVPRCSSALPEGFMLVGPPSGRVDAAYVLAEGGYVAELTRTASAWSVRELLRTVQSGDDPTACGWIPLRAAWVDPAGIAIRFRRQVPAIDVAQRGGRLEEETLPGEATPEFLAYSPSTGLLVADANGAVYRRVAPGSFEALPVVVRSPAPVIAVTDDGFVTSGTAGATTVAWHEGYGTCQTQPFPSARPVDRLVQLGADFLVTSHPEGGSRQAVRWLRKSEDECAIDPR